MTQEFVTLPREVVDQAMKAMSLCRPHMYDHASNTQDCAFDLLCDAVNALRTALDQPQAEQPAMTPIAQRKLDDLVASGYTISGYSVYHEQKHQHGFVTGAGLVGWWKPEGVEYPQPQVEQEPVPEHKLKDVRCECCGYMTNHREHMGCIRAAQPKREPLTDEQIIRMVNQAGWDAVNLEDGFGERIRRYTEILEAAHNK